MAQGNKQSVTRLSYVHESFAGPYSSLQCNQLTSSREMKIVEASQLFAAGVELQ